MACSSLGARSETSFTAFSSGFSSSGGSWLRSIGFVHTTRHRDKSSSSTLKPPVILGYLCVHRLDSIYFHPKAVPRHERSISLYFQSQRAVSLSRHVYLYKYTSIMSHDERKHTEHVSQHTQLHEKNSHTQLPTSVESSGLKLYRLNQINGEFSYHRVRSCVSGE